MHQLEALVKVGANEGIKAREVLIINAFDRGRNMYKRKDKMGIDEWINEITEYGQNITKVKSSQQLVIVRENLERERKNGGFNRFYIYSSGNHSKEKIS